MVKSFFDYFPPPRFLDMPFFGLDISPRAVRVVDLHRELGALHLGRFGERKLVELVSPETITKNSELKKVLQSLKREFNLKFIKASLPESAAYLFKTEVDAKLTNDEIVSEIEIHLEENVPLSGEEAVFDYHIIKRSSTKIELTVTVLPKAIIDNYANLFNECDLTVLSFMFQPTAISRAVIPKKDKGTYIVVNLAETESGIFVVGDGAVQFTSTVSIGSENLTAAIIKQFSVSPEEAEKIKREKGLIKKPDTNELYLALANAVSVLRDEIERVFIYWQSHKEKQGQAGERIEKIILVGRDAVMTGLKDHLTLSLKVPVEIGNVWSNAFSFDVEIPAINKDDSLDYASAIGLCLPK
ncbi:MAG: pilus assembly protein PilM [bacterium]